MHPSPVYRGTIYCSVRSSLTSIRRVFHTNAPPKTTTARRDGKRPSGISSAATYPVRRPTTRFTPALHSHSAYIGMPSST